MWKARFTAIGIREEANFFEFVGSLKKLGQLSSDDVRALIDYYLRNLANHDWIRNFVKESGFESLDALLNDPGRKAASWSTTFVYGSLRKGGGNDMYHFLAAKSTYLGMARVRGILYQLGDYPGLVLEDSADVWAVRELFALTDADQTFTALDAYERIRPGGSGTARVRKDSAWGVLARWRTNQSMDRCV
jgi:gamma-glutamylcyclotransferase (GGCT)/AIG2-like uncharacterized protein YtfP